MVAGDAADMRDRECDRLDVLEARAHLFGSSSPRCATARASARTSGALPLGIMR